MYNKLWDMLIEKGFNPKDYHLEWYNEDPDNGLYDCDNNLLTENGAMAWMICNFWVASNDDGHSMNVHMLIWYVAWYMSAIWENLICDVKVFNDCIDPSKTSDHKTPQDSSWVAPGISPQPSDS